MQPIVFVIAIFGYIALGGLLVQTLDGLPSNQRPIAAIIFLLVWVSGWIWLLGSLALGSARGGAALLRGWIALMGGMFIAMAPIVLLPHPIAIAGGVIAGAAFGSWIITGKARWIHKN